MNTLNEKLIVTNIGKEVNDWLSDYVFELEFNRKFDHYEDVKKKEGIVESTWLITSVSNLYSPSDYPSAEVLLHYDQNDELFMSHIHGDRWIDLWKAAEKAIVYSGTKQCSLIGGFSGNPSSRCITLAN